ncbi:hypothetical protein RSOLAG22IIIB_09542 [Rhizoctonia solani]|uniref:F-box domain-containing protein n=1 Tax=Rhizoctonia solani TaxID=456999 RepID=A0A0K6FZA7_9AGAM|nr:hypothetical protein RSOLAG22IIIB_09542 [Rhizoctonia solani]
MHLEQDFKPASSYEAEIQHFKSVLNQLRNFSGTSLAISINRLPPEVLARIFEDVVNAGPCPVLKHRLQKQPKSTFLKDPILLSHVCSYWRRVALDTAVLWSHLDLKPGWMHVSKISARVDSYLGRSGDALLDIHIAEVRFPREPYFNPTSADPALIDLLTLTSPRMRSLRLAIPTGCEEAYRSCLVTCFSHCTPGNLKSVSVRCAEVDGSHIGPSLVEDSDFNRGEDRMMGMPSTISEEVWDTVKVLELKAFRPEWNSKAYRGLRELRLVRLHVLELDLELESDTIDDSITAANLKNLEIFILGGSRQEQHGPILQLVAPGPNSLSLSLVNPYIGSSRFVYKDELARFITRSNVTRLCTHEFNTYSQVAEVLSLMPGIRTLALNALDSGAIEAGSAPLEHNIDVLYVINCCSRFSRFGWPQLEHFVENHHVQKLVLWRYDFRYCGLSEIGIETIPNNLFTICPVVQVIHDTAPNPIVDWFGD